MKRFIAYLLMVMVFLQACGSAPASQPSSVEPTIEVAATEISPTIAAAEAEIEATADATRLDLVTLTDANGRDVTFNPDAQRIISLAPSTTEILYALGVQDRLVATDDVSDYPAEVAELPKVGNGYSSFNYEQIVALEPDLLLVAGITSPEVLSRLEELAIPIVVTNSAITTFDTVFSDILLTGEVTNSVEAAESLVAQLKAKKLEIESKVALATSRPKVYWELDATDASKPFSVGPGGFINDLITMSGGENIFGTIDNPYPQVSIEQIAVADPEVIILANAIYGTTVESVLDRPGWGDISAVREQRVYPIDDNLISRPGPRLIDGLEATAKIIHPELFQ
jgi:iron complex transport system substrate-binding protein